VDRCGRSRRLLGRADGNLPGGHQFDGFTHPGDTRLSLVRSRNERSLGRVCDRVSWWPETRTFDFAVPEQQHEREMRGLVVPMEGLSASGIRVYLIDENGRRVASESADDKGRFRIRGYTGTAYVIHGIRSGDGSDRSVMSSTPVGIAAGVESAEVRLVLDQPGDSYLESQRKTKWWP
jgi:hypothetical protein